eukprot:TRINITY_DN66690_c5_g1_i2.p1 TRINITY_DN66690_c5_g1~~TRINITY_DN66690_c5_g1_i2.p1  ORF type:complete len:483 (+),score=27.25 TRINITY_DN66690_c5_g1_i2:27-1475(+)
MSLGSLPVDVLEVVCSYYSGDSFKLSCRRMWNLLKYRKLQPLSVFGWAHFVSDKPPQVSQVRSLYIHFTTDEGTKSFWLQPVYNPQQQGEQEQPEEITETHVVEALQSLPPSLESLTLSYHRSNYAATVDTLKCTLNALVCLRSLTLGDVGNGFSLESSWVEHLPLETFRLKHHRIESEALALQIKNILLDHKDTLLHVELQLNTKLLEHVVPVLPKRLRTLNLSWYHRGGKESAELQSRAEQCLTEAISNMPYLQHLTVPTAAVLSCNPPKLLSYTFEVHDPADYTPVLENYIETMGHQLEALRLYFANMSSDLFVSVAKLTHLRDLKIDFSHHASKVPVADVKLLLQGIAAFNNLEELSLGLTHTKHGPLVCEALVIPPAVWSIELSLYATGITDDILLDDLWANLWVPSLQVVELAFGNNDGVQSDEKMRQFFDVHKVLAKSPCLKRLSVGFAYTDISDTFEDDMDREWGEHVKFAEFS